MEEFKRLMGQLPHGTTIEVLTSGDYMVHVRKNDVYFSEDPIDALKQAVDGENDE